MTKTEAQPGPMKDALQSDTMKNEELFNVSAIIYPASLPWETFLNIRIQ